MNDFGRRIERLKKIDAGLYELLNDLNISLPFFFQIVNYMEEKGADFSIISDYYKRQILLIYCKLSEVLELEYEL